MATKTMGEVVADVLTDPLVLSQLEAIAGMTSFTRDQLRAALITLATSAALAAFGAGQLAERERILAAFNLAAPAPASRNGKG